MSDLDIAEVAQRAGVTAATLRFYEEKGLIASVGRRGLRRCGDVRRSQFPPLGKPRLEKVDSRFRPEAGHPGEFEAVGRDLGLIS